MGRTSSPTSPRERVQRRPARQAHAAGGAIRFALACLVALALGNCAPPIPHTAPIPDGVERARANAALALVPLELDCESAELRAKLERRLRTAGFKLVASAGSASGAVRLRVDGHRRLQSDRFELSWHLRLDAALTQLQNGVVEPVGEASVEHGGSAMGEAPRTHKALEQQTDRLVAWLVAKLVELRPLQAVGDSLARSAELPERPTRVRVLLVGLNGASPSPAPPTSAPVSTAPSAAPSGSVAAASAPETPLPLAPHPCAEVTVRAAAQALAQFEPQSLLGAAATRAAVLRAVEQQVRATGPKELLLVLLSLPTASNAGVWLLPADGDAAAPLATGLRLEELSRVLRTAKGKALLLLDGRGDANSAGARAELGGLATTFALRPAATTATAPTTCDWISSALRDALVGANDRDGLLTARELALALGEGWEAIGPRRVALPAMAGR